MMNNRQSSAKGSSSAWPSWLELEVSSTLLGAARGAVAIGFFRSVVGRNVSFFELSYYMFPLGVVMVGLLWGYLLIYFRPEKKRIPGLRRRVVRLSAALGPIKREEVLVLVFVGSAIILLSL